MSINWLNWKQFFQVVSADDVVVFAGSAPSNLGNKVYNKFDSTSA